MTSKVKKNNINFNGKMVSIGIVSENLPPLDTATYDVMQGSRCIYSDSPWHDSV